jgi:hypothetical protein
MFNLLPVYPAEIKSPLKPARFEEEMPGCHQLIHCTQSGIKLDILEGSADTKLGNLIKAELR